MPPEIDADVPHVDLPDEAGEGLAFARSATVVIHRW